MNVRHRRIALLTGASTTALASLVSLVDRSPARDRSFVDDLKAPSIVALPDLNLCQWNPGA